MKRQDRSERSCQDSVFSLHRFFAAGSVLLLLLATSVACSSSEPAEERGLFPGVRESSELDGPILATGQLTDSEGNGVPGTVTAVAWPVMEILSNLQTGESANTLTAAWATTDEDGMFTLRIDPKVVMDQHVESNGVVNFDLRAFEGTQVTEDSRFALFAFSRQMSADGSRWLEPGSSADVTAIPIELVLLEREE